MLGIGNTTEQSAQTQYRATMEGLNMENGNLNKGTIDFTGIDKMSFVITFHLVINILYLKKLVW